MATHGVRGERMKRRRKAIGIPEVQILQCMTLYGVSASFRPQDF